MGPSMQRCECAELAFAEMAEVSEREGIADFETLCDRTGGCRTCTACRDDLLAYLRAHRPEEATASVR
jgi:NAD(P)H-nitrite reductase large subunit